MARPRTIAIGKKGKSETKKHLKERAKIEDELRGEDSLLKQAPEWLDDYGIEYYNFILNQLEDFHILGNLDIPVIAQTADCLSKMEQLDEYLKENELIIIIEDKIGNQIPKENPAISTKLKYLIQFRALATQLGLSPSSRAQLAEMKMQKKEEDNDPVTAILNGTD